MKKHLRILSMVLCCMLACAMFAGCVAAGPGGQEEPEAKQTVYLPATYKYVGERKNTMDGKKETYTIEKQFTYDDAGRCVSCVITEDSQELGHRVFTLTFAYDEQGNLICEYQQGKTERGVHVTEGDSQYTLRYTYDEQGCVEHCEIERTYHYIIDGETSGSGTSTKSYGIAYDTQGNLIALTVGTEGQLWYYYSYDEQGQMIAQTECTLLPEGDPNADLYKYRYVQTVYERDAQGKITSTYGKLAYSTENVGQSGLDRLEFEFSGNCYVFHYDENGNLTDYNLPGVTESEQQKYDENGQWIPEDKYETIKYRGEMIDRVLAKYTLDEQGNVIKFENYQYTEELTYTALELTQTQAKRTEHFFHDPTFTSQACELPNYVFRNFYPSWWRSPTYYSYFVNLFKNLPW